MNRKSLTFSSESEASARCLSLLLIGHKCKAFSSHKIVFIVCRPLLGAFAIIWRNLIVFIKLSRPNKETRNHCIIDFHLWIFEKLLLLLLVSIFSKYCKLRLYIYIYSVQFQFAWNPLNQTTSKREVLRIWPILVGKSRCENQVNMFEVHCIIINDWKHENTLIELKTFLQSNWKALVN